MALFGFGGRRSPADQGRRDAILAWVREAGGWDEAVVVKVSEIVCADPACPGLETVILVMVPGHPTHAVKLPGPMAEVTRAGIEAALSPGA